eukprot:TRINITY_DN22736_c0_g1_i1.p1 TRINITY_DN22736_c0_g1~~TRINITY_DN22736_c0_g1_i1.p1  ORF type:complete len:144 (-),score=28.16 TRINITY_DN22736_c0_g1_i1:47-478(-)
MCIRDRYLKLKIQSRKNDYIDKVQRKIKAISINRPLDCNNKLQIKRLNRKPHPIQTVPASPLEVSLNNSTIDAHQPIDSRSSLKSGKLKTTLIAKRIKAATSATSKAKPTKRDDCETILEQELMLAKELYSACLLYTSDAADE